MPSESPSTAQRLALLVRRSWQARAFGVRFFGTTHFRLPRLLHVAGQQRELAIPPGEFGPAQDFINLFLDDEYGLREISSPPATILDLGANCGLFSLLARHYFPQAKIHAYEPNPRAFQYAVRNLKSLDVRVFEAGVGAEEGMASLVDTADSRLAQTVTKEGGSIHIVPVAEAVSALDVTVDLMKIDCEGAEWSIFQVPSAFENVRAIRMEYHLDATHGLQEFREAVRKLGFQIDRIVENSGFGMAWLSRTSE